MVYGAAALAQARAKLSGLGTGQVLLAPAFLHSANTLNPSAVCLKNKSLTGEFGSRAVTLTLSNPARRNALSGRMMVQLADHVDRLMEDGEYSDATCVVVRGEGGFFCSGADLSSATKDLQSPQDGMDMCVLMQSTLHKLRALPLVSVAAIQGGAVGGGTELALACDMRVIEHNAVFQMVHASMGLSPGWGGATRLSRLIGRSNALDVLINGHRFTGIECVERRLADASASAGEEFDELIARKLENFTGKHPDAIRACKQAVAAGELPVAMALQAEAQVFGGVWGGEANRSAVENAMRAKAKRKKV